MGNLTRPNWVINLTIDEMWPFKCVCVCCIDMYICKCISTCVCIYIYILYWLYSYIICIYIYIYVCMYCIGRGCILVYPLVIRHCYGKWPVCFVCNDDFLQKSDCIGNHSGYPRMGWILSNSIHLWEIFRILKWRYVSTIFLAIFWYPLGLKIGIFFIVGTSNLGSWNGYWTYLYLSIRIPANPIKSNHNRHVDRVGHTIQVPLQPRCTQYMLLPSQLLGHWPAPLLGSFTFLRTMMLLMSLYIETEIDIDMYI